MRRVLGKWCGARPGGGGVTSSTVVGGTHGSRPTTTHFVGQGPRALPWVRCDVGGRTEASAPTDDKEICASPGAGRCGERTERCRWQKKRGERVAAVKISGVRRKAAWKFWAPQQDHRPLRKCILRCVGEGLCPSHGRGKTPPLRKRYKGRRGVFANVGQPKKEKNAHPCVLFFLERGRKSLATKQFSVSAISWHGRELGAAPHAFPRPALPWR